MDLISETTEAVELEGWSSDLSWEAGKDRGD